MECRSKENARGVICAALLSAAMMPAAELRYEVTHDHLFRNKPGVLTIDERGVSFQEISKKKKKRKPEELHHGTWAWQDIQQLYVSPERLVLVTYKDRPLLLGIDREYEFTLPRDRNFADVHALLKNKLDQRFVAAVADESVIAVWEMPVKLQGTLRGSEGVLRVGEDRIVYQTDRKERSRTWRFDDIENVSTSGRFQLTLTTYERAKTHYGSMKSFNFQLKQPLDEKRFELLWKRLNRAKAMEFLRTSAAP